MPNTRKPTGKKLSEAAADVLAATIAATRPKSDSFGLGNKLNPAGVMAKQDDLGEPVQRSSQSFPNYLKGVPTAVPPGATPPVSKEPMHHIDSDRGKQPQETEGQGDNKDPTGPISYNINTYMNRLKNKPDSVTPGKGNVNMPWAHESVEDLAHKVLGELANPTLSEEDKEDGKKKSKFFDKDDKFNKMMSKVKTDCKEDVSEDEVFAILLGMYEQDSFVSAEERLAAVVAEALEENRENLSLDVGAMFEGETLSDEFKEKATTIFETAVFTQVKSITDKLQDEAVKLVTDAALEIEEAMTDQVDQYLSYMVENWINENEIAIEKGLRAEIVEDFIGGLRTLFIENYIDIPEEKVDLVDELATKVAELEEQISSEIEKNMEFKNRIDEFHKANLIDSVCEGLTVTQKAKISNLAENVSYGSEKEFKAKVTTLRENYFPKSSIVKPGADSLNTDQLIMEDGTNVITDPMMRLISDTISRTAKR